MREARDSDSPPDDPQEMGRSSIAGGDKDSFKVIDDHIERARQYHAQHGVWPPDPLLDEVDEMRRKIMAEHGNDWRKVLQWHVDQDRLHREGGEVAKSAVQERSAGVSGQ